jgi:hypothetical protein
MRSKLFSPVSEDNVLNQNGACASGACHPGLLPPCRHSLLAPKSVEEPTGFAEHSLRNIFVVTERCGAPMERIGHLKEYLATRFVVRFLTTLFQLHRSITYRI